VSPLPPPPRRPPWYRDAIGDTLTVLGLAVIGGGAAVWGVAEQQIDFARSQSNYGAFVEQALSHPYAPTERAIGIGAVAAGGALVVAGIVRYALRPKRAASERAVAVASGTHP
jgi:hypothetical protein